MKIFDSSTTPINEIIAQAKQAGINALVGPLLKQNVDAIVANPAVVQGMDVLTLNTTPNTQAINQLCYYGLSPEDEAESAATKMWNDGVRNPVVAMPQNELGQRVGNAFNVRWQKLTSTDANIRYYNLAADVPYFFQENGADANALYVVANPDELAEIKGYLTNNNAANVKIYASSRSNAATNSADYAAQMNGVQFSDIPFFKESSGTQYKKVAGSTGGEYQLMRLYAMGSDAWLLINHFNELRQVPGYRLNGLTGILSAGPNCNVERDMTWFQYQDANAVPISN